MHMHMHTHTLYIIVNKIALFLAILKVINPHYQNSLMCLFIFVVVFWGVEAGFAKFSLFWGQLLEHLILNKKLSALFQDALEQ